MCTDKLNDKAKAANVATLAASLGISPDAAEELLEISIILQYEEGEPAAKMLADEVEAMLSRTVSAVTVSPVCGLASTVVITAETAAYGRSVQTHAILSQSGCHISDTPSALAHGLDIHPLHILLCACYVSGAVISRAMPVEFPHKTTIPMHVNFLELLPYECLQKEIDLGVAYLAGGGAIGNGFLWALRHANVTGDLHVCDDDRVSDGNLNRQLWFKDTDIGSYKADRLVEKAQDHFQTLTLHARRDLLQNMPERRDNPKWLRCLIVAVDSRLARRHLQDELPGEVFDASTTDISEVIIHHNREPNEAACLSCIYHETPNEVEFEAHVAESLGVTVEEVRSGRVSESAAQAIASKNERANISVEDILGMAYDSLFKQLCGQQTLTSQEGKQILAPFCFVSVLAGTLLAIEVIKRLSWYEEGDYNYWKVSPWHSPISRLRRQRSRLDNCDFCSDEYKKMASKLHWGTVTT